MTADDAFGIGFCIGLAMGALIVLASVYIVTRGRR